MKRFNCTLDDNFADLLDFLALHYNVSKRAVVAFALENLYSQVLAAHVRSE